MKRSLVLIATLIVSLTTAFLWGCGGGGGTPGQPGSQGTEDIGVTFDATITPFYLGGNFPEVDVIPIVDCDPSTPQLENEPFTDHFAVLRLNVRQIDPNSTNEPKSLFIEKYSVEYRRAADSIGAPPIQSDTKRDTITIQSPSGGGTNTVTTSVMLLDLIRKDIYREDVQSGQYAFTSDALLNNYTATYTFEGKDQNGTPFRFQAQTNFIIGSFNYCD